MCLCVDTLSRKFKAYSRPLYNYLLNELDIRGQSNVLSIIHARVSTNAIILYDDPQSICFICCGT